MKASLEHIGKALGGKAKPGGGWMCHCPSHDDTNPSLSVDLGDNGNLVVKCWAGCSQQAVISALRTRGLWPDRQHSTIEHQTPGTKRRNGEKGNHSAADRQAIDAAQRWAMAGPADPGHPYLAGKCLVGGSLRQEGNLLLVPMRDPAGVVQSIQTIDPGGRKLFPKNARVSGLHCLLGDQGEPNRPVCIAEGWATGEAIHSATGGPVAVAFTAANLATVALIVLENFPGHQIIICADDDHDPDKEKNTGMEAATSAALSVGGLLAVPNMGRKADFWDLWHEQGPDAVRGAIAAATPIDAAVEATTDESGPEDPEAMIHYLAGLSAIEYEQKRRAVADALGVRASALDRAVKEAGRGQNDNRPPFDEPAPWPEPVDPGQLLTDIAITIQRFIVCADEVAHAVALWAAMTWFIDVVQVAPLAVITAPEKRCGKSQLLFLLGRLSARALTASSISPAALYRAIDAWQPTLLIDEADAFMKDNEELRGIINSGHTRDSAYVIRTVGDNFTPAKFNTWGAKALAGIGHVADTIMDRSVVLELRRKLPHEEVDRLRHAGPDLFSTLQEKLARFANDYSEQVRLARPPLPACLNDRAQDNWEPLLAIAMVAGGQWLEVGTKAAVKLSGSGNPVETIGTELLTDIKEIFEMNERERISTADLIRALCDDDEKAWATYNRGNPISPRQLANKLKGYGITSTTLRFRHTGLAKGYERKQFEEAFSRYIPVEHRVLSVTA